MDLRPFTPAEDESSSDGLWTSPFLCGVWELLPDDRQQQEAQDEELLRELREGAQDADFGSLWAS
eukprot:10748986-Lingulodinium_polyedra.AAC.1